MTTRGRPRSVTYSRLTILVATLAASLAPPGYAARGLISANQHPVLSSDDCDDAPAFPALGASPDVSAQAYHVDKDWSIFDQARCYNHYEKPRIFSDDGGFDGLPANQRQKDYIVALCGDITSEDPERARGVEHYEHWEQSLTPQAKLGDTIGGYNTWPTDAQGMADFLKNDSRIQGCASVLAPNGKLKRDTANTRRLLWNANPVTLIGFGHMGALAAGNRTLLVRIGQQDGYLGSIRKWGANFTRIWALEQWSGLATCHQPHLEGLTPFSGSYDGKYNLSIEGLNPAFFRGLRDFVQLAADRGIVVHLSLFDKHGMVQRTCMARWDGSPYNMLRNTTQDPRFVDGSALNSDCGCRLCGTEVGESPENPPTCNTIDDVLDHLSIVPIHAAYLRRVAQEIGGAGNVIFEIMNEMYAGYDWPTIGAGWQQDSVAAPLNWQLPVFVARDAFNDEPANDLTNKPPDAGPVRWLGVVNAKVWPVADPETGIRMGKVKGYANSTETQMKGALQLPNAELVLRTALSVRANLWRQAGTKMELGLSSGLGEWLRVEITDPQLLSTFSRVAITKKIGSTTFTLATTLAAIGVDADVRLYVDLSNPAQGVRGTVYVEGVPLPALTDVSLLPLPVLDYAEFRGSRDGSYTDAHGSIDNFEADVYCSDPAAGC